MINPKGFYGGTGVTGYCLFHNKMNKPYCKWVITAYPDGYVYSGIKGQFVSTVHKKSKEVFL